MKQACNQPMNGDSKEVIKTKANEGSETNIDYICGENGLGNVEKMSCKIHISAHRLILSAVEPCIGIAQTLD